MLGWSRWMTCWNTGCVCVYACMCVTVHVCVQAYVLLLSSCFDRSAEDCLLWYV